MANTLATMLTMTTYGTWLRGDRRGWIDHGEIFPPDPELESADRARMKHPVFLFPRDGLLDVGQFIGASLVERLQLKIYALTIGTWHAHIVIGPTRHAIGDVVRTAKDAARYGLKIYDRPHLDRRVRQTLLFRRALPAQPHSIRRTPQRASRLAGPTLALPHAI